MTNQEAGARVQALMAKQAAGTITPAELEELKKLLANAPEMKPGGTIKPPSQADFDAAKAKAAAAETDKQRAAAAQEAAANGGSGPDLVAASAAVPAVRPDQMGINPALPPLPGYGKTPAGEPVKLPPAGQTGQENPVLHPPVAEPKPKATSSFLAAIPDTDVKPPEEQPGYKQATWDDVPKAIPGSVEQPTPPVPANRDTTAASDVDGMPSYMTAVDENNASMTPEERAAASATPDATPVASSDAKDLAGATSPKKFGEVLKDLAGKYGVPLLDIMQAFAYGKSGNVTAPTRLDTETANKLAMAAKKMEAEYLDKLEQGRMRLQQANQESLLTKQQSFAASQQAGAQTFAAGQNAQTQAFQMSENDKQRAWEQAKQDATLAAQAAGLDKTLTSEELRAKIAADTNKKYYELMYGPGAQQKAGAKIQTQFGM